MKRKVKSSLFITSSDDDQVEFKSALRDVNDNFILYLVINQTSSLAWKQILTVKHQQQIVINDLKFRGY